MGDRQTIEHPAESDTIPVWTFAAFGFVPSEIRKVRIALRDPNNKPTPIITLLRRADHDDDGFWSWLVTVAQDGNNYTLELRNADTGGLIKPPVKFNVHKGARQLGITYPAADATVTPSFTAYGTQGAGHSIRVTMTPPPGSGNPVSQQATVNVNTQSWYAIFYSLAPGGGWTLKAEDEKGDSDTHKNITVKQ